MNINHFFDNFTEQILKAELIVNTQTQSLHPTIQPGLHLNLLFPELTKVVQFNQEMIRGIPPEIWKNIQVKTKHTLTYSIPPFRELISARRITFVVACQDDLSASANKVREINAMVRKCLTWLYLAQKNARRNKCNESPLVIYLLLSPTPKLLPVVSPGTRPHDAPVLNWNNANSAFTMICKNKNDLAMDGGGGSGSGSSGLKKELGVRQIVIFREEEWFKVFIHETFHNFGFDFSNASEELIRFSADAITNKLYPVSSKVNLYEAYTECWARIISIIFACASNLQQKNEGACLDSHFAKEIQFSQYQAAKVLQYMGISSYAHLIQGYEQVRDLYREKTSILAYYIITCVLFTDYGDFIRWCYHQRQGSGAAKKSGANTFVLADYIMFQPNKENMLSFLQFIHTHYKNPAMVKKIDGYIRDLSNIKRKSAVHKTLRMTAK